MKKDILLFDNEIFIGLAIMVYEPLLKTGSLDNAIRDFSLA